MRRSPWLRASGFAGASLLVLALLAGSSASAAASKHGKPHAKPAHHVEMGLYPEMALAAHRGDWSRANTLARSADDPLAPALAEWLYLTDDDTTPSFDELSAFLDAHPSWPGRIKMTTKAEQAIPEGTRPKEILAWFGDRDPRTGDGAVRLGEAKMALGDETGGEALIRRAWTDLDFTPDSERRAMAQHAALLAGPPTAARIDRLLWQRRTDDANRLLDSADDAGRARAKARMTLIASPERAATLAAGLPDKLQNDTGILYELTRAQRRNGDTAAAVPIALKADPGVAAARWWPERHALAREALTLGLYQEAYRLASEHHLSAGPDFADAEWLAGWIALRFLDKPRDASDHFMTLYKSVSYPVSKARGAYWAARAAEAGGHLGDATDLYLAAAAFETTYYGQLARVRLAQDNATLRLPAQPAGGHNALAGTELVRAARLANETGSDAVTRPFFMALGEAADTAEEYLYAGKLALELGHPGYAVRIAKKAMQDDIVLTDIAYPTLGVPRGGDVSAEPALVLGISRQESEFDTRAQSPTGARGLMQLMPATAKVVARQEHLQFDPARLEDPSYNMRLGTAYLGDLIDRFGGSYALAVAAYNAGPTHAREWLAANGDPRDPNVDPIDWVEKIPFSETRNYVQRVLENTEVYRERLAHGPVPLRLAADLARPNSNRPAGADLTAYLPHGTDIDVAAAGESGARPAKATKHLDEPKPEAVAMKEPPPAPVEPAPVEAVPPEAPAPQAKAETLASPPPPKPVEVTSAAPQAVAAVPPAPPAILPEPKPTLPAKASAKSKDKALASKPAKASSRTATAKAEPAAPADAPPAEPAGAADGPAANPFGNGQPETRGVPASCSRMILGLNGKPHCADRQASAE